MHAKELVNCLQHVKAFKDKVTVEMLSMTYMGSQAAEVKKSKLNQVPEYGKGKNHFKSLTALVGFIHYLIIHGIFHENLRDTEERMKPTYLSIGNVRELARTEKG